VSFDRATALRRLADEHFDVLVIGGGITGAGVAVDAATRGLRTALVERHDIASGTSSKSSKLVHGGIRYLQQREVGLVYEALAERQVLRKTAPHLVRVLPFLLPVFTRDGLLPRRIARLLGATMWMYDLTGGLRIGKLHQRVSKEKALGYMPTLPAERIAASYVYYDAQTDDARLTLAIARTAADYGAAVANYTNLVGLDKSADGRVQTACVVADGRTIDVRASVVVNATGVWSDDVRALDEGVHPASIRPAKGVHITVPWSLVQNKIAVVIPVPKDRRSVFVVPWAAKAATTSSPTSARPTPTTTGPLDDPQITAADVKYLLGAINAAVTTTITEADILGTWAGLRPLVKAAKSERTADLSRRHSVRTSDSGVITVTGGKLTTYRRMAADAVDAAIERLGIHGRRSRTRRIRLHGAAGWDAPGLPNDLATRYGGDAHEVLALCGRPGSSAKPIVPGLAYTRAEVVYAVARRDGSHRRRRALAPHPRALLARDASAERPPRWPTLMAAELGWSRAERDRQIEEYRALDRPNARSAGCPRPRSTHSQQPPS
jgi:glycerol-3-phosphate dehydrogenase